MDHSAVKSQFSQILTAAKERRGDLSVDTMIVSSHLAQMRTFMLRRGIEFYADKMATAIVESSSSVSAKTICLR